MTEWQTYTIAELTGYIDWSYFYHAWSIKHGQQGEEEALRLHADALKMLEELEGKLTIQTLYRPCTAYSDGDNLLLDDLALPLLRQQTRTDNTLPYLCLSDFVRPLAAGIPDRVGVFAASVSEQSGISNQESFNQKSSDPYRQLLVHTLCDRLVEAAVEKLHRKLQPGGIRPAVGYPSLPDQSVIFLLDKLLHLQRIGIRLTEHGAMHPHASVCGLLLAHPQARYFSIGKIDEEQLNDYARRRDMPPQAMRKFLQANL